MHELLQTVGQEAARVLRGERPLSVVNAGRRRAPQLQALGDLHSERGTVG
jgi:hypothetical protein